MRSNLIVEVTTRADTVNTGCTEREINGVSSRERESVRI